MANAFRSSRLIYRAFEENNADLTFLHPLTLDAESFAKYEGTLFKPLNKKWTQEQTLYAHKTSFMYVIICLQTPPGDTAKPSTPIGQVNLHRIPHDQRHHRNTNIGIHISHEYQNQGYGSEAINWILNWGFQMGGLHRIGIGCSSYSPGAKRLYERLEFVVEGVLRETLWYDGEWHDDVILGMLKREWRARNEKGSNGGSMELARVGKEVDQL